MRLSLVRGWRARVAKSAALALRREQRRTRNAEMQGGNRAALARRDPARPRVVDEGGLCLSSGWPRPCGNPRRIRGRSARRVCNAHARGARTRRRTPRTSARTARAVRAASAGRRPSAARPAARSPRKCRCNPGTGGCTGSCRDRSPPCRRRRSSGTSSSNTSNDAPHPPAPGCRRPCGCSEIILRMDMDSPSLRVEAKQSSFDSAGSLDAASSRSSQCKLSRAASRYVRFSFRLVESRVGLDRDRLVLIALAVGGLIGWLLGSRGSAAGEGGGANRSGSSSTRCVRSATPSAIDRGAARRHGDLPPATPRRSRRRRSANGRSRNGWPKFKPPRKRWARNSPKSAAKLLESAQKQFLERADQRFKESEATSRQTISRRCCSRSTTASSDMRRRCSKVEKRAQGCVRAARPVISRR